MRFPSPSASGAAAGGAPPDEVSVGIHVDLFGGDDLPADWIVRGLRVAIDGEEICRVEKAGARHGVLRVHECGDAPVAASVDSGVPSGEEERDEEGIFTLDGRYRTTPAPVGEEGAVVLVFQVSGLHFRVRAHVGPLGQAHEQPAEQRERCSSERMRESEGVYMITWLT